MEYDEIIRLAWQKLGSFRRPPTQEQIDRMVKNAREECGESRSHIKKIGNVLILGVFSILAALFIVITHIEADAIEYPYFTLSLIFIVLVLYHMYTLIMIRRSLKKNISENEAAVKMAAPLRDNFRSERIYVLSVENEELARYLEDMEGRTLTQCEADAIDMLKKKL